MNKKKLSVLPALSAAALAIPAALLFPGIPSRRQRAPFEHRNIAHRGLHTEDTLIPENSIPAFRAAADAGYGVELDIQLTKDGQVVVFHDNDLERVCGLRAPVCEKTYAELQQLRLCGSNETIPLFSEVLALINGRTPIICELKSGNRNRELCRKAYALIKAYPGDLCIESFNPMIVAWFRRHGKELLRGQLATGSEHYEDSMSKPLRYLLSRCLLSAFARPQFIAYDISDRLPLSVRLQRLCGAMLVGWTSHDFSAESGHDAVIFEYYRPRTKY